MKQQINREMIGRTFNSYKFVEMWYFCTSFEPLALLPYCMSCIPYSFLNYKTILLYFSTVSSGVNSLAAVMLEDVIKMVYKKRTQGQLRDETSTQISKVLGRLQYLR